jgi:hypothetical protein
LGMMFYFSVILINLLSQMSPLLVMQDIYCNTLGRRDGNRRKNYYRYPNVQYLQTFVDVAVDSLGKIECWDAISTMLGTPIVSLGTDINKWIGNDNSEKSIRSAVGIAAKKTLSGWFKNISAGERLGKIVTSAIK